MDRRQAAADIKARWQELYPLDKCKGGIICPLCGSGSGPHGTGISEDRSSNNHFLKCWHAGCEFEKGGSVIDLYMLETGETNFTAAVDALAERLGILIDEPADRPAAGDDFIVYVGHDSPDPAQGTRPDGSEEQAADIPFIGQSAGAAAMPGETERERNSEGICKNPAEMPDKNYREYYAISRERLRNSPEAQAYLEARGISMGTAEMYALGFDPAWVNPKAIETLKAKGNSWRPDPTPRIIIPSSNTHYVARDIRPYDEMPEAAQKYAKMNEGSPDIFGMYWAKKTGAENIFITEGAFDALSVIEAGQIAIALNSTTNAGKLIKQLEAEPMAATFIICLDSDDSGRKTAAQLQDGLRRLNIPCTEADINGPYKDPNEYLVKDRAGFEEAIARAIERTAARPDSIVSYIENGGLVSDIERRREIGIKSTGFSNLDAKTGGGLRPGLFLVGAISSLGKTTFCSQMADGMAAAGHDVLYFSLEQSRLEMVAKCISRETAKIDMSRAVTSSAIMDGSRAEIIGEAARNYAVAVGDRISIIEAGMNCDTQYITEYVRNYHKRTGARPVVFVDYLQVLKPAELPNGRRQERREAVEECLTQLVLLKRELDLTIIAIVSLNRNNYLQPFDFEAIKETGLAEYSADVVWGLQLQCLDEDLFTEQNKLKEKRERVRNAKAEIPRKVKLCSVKHRGQQAVYNCSFDYYPQYDLFVPTVDIPAATTETPRKAGRKLKV